MDIQDFKMYLSIKRALGNSTVESYCEKLNYFLQWIEKENLTPSASSIEKFLYLKRDNPATINLYIVLFRHLEGYLKDRGSPTDLVSAFKPRKIERPAIQILSVEEVKKLLLIEVPYQNNNWVFKYTSDTYRVFTEFLYLTCCRVSEAINLTVGNVDLGEGWITFVHTKGKKVRRVPIQEPLISHLRPLLVNKGKDEAVFKTYRNTKLLKSNYWRDLQRRAKAAGITTHLHAHIFRHSGASHLVLNGVPIEMVGKILGHEDIGLTMNTYVHLKDEQIRNAMFQMPYYKENINPKEIIKNIVSTIRGLKLQDDKRFNFKLLQGSNSLELILYIK